MSKKVTQTVMHVIADRLAQGETLVQICKDKDMPAYRTVTYAVQKDDKLWEIYRKGRTLQAEYYGDHIIDLAITPLPASVDPKLMNAEVQRRRLEIDTLKWTFARNQPFGLRDKKEDAAANQGSITLSWANGEVSADI